MFWPALITSHCYKLVMVLPNINGLCWNFPWLFSALGWMFWQQSFNHFVGQRNRDCSTSFKVTIWYLHYLEEDLWMWQREDSVYWRCLLQSSWNFFCFVFVLDFDNPYLTVRYLLCSLSADSTPSPQNCPTWKLHQMSPAPRLVTEKNVFPQSPRRRSELMCGMIRTTTFSLI